MRSINSHSQRTPKLCITLHPLRRLDKEINTYAMRAREWFGWHFPEMGKIVDGIVPYCKAAKKMGFRQRCKDCDFSDIFEDDAVEAALKEAAEVSMGTDVSVVGCGLFCCTEEKEPRN